MQSVSDFRRIRDRLALGETVYLDKEYIKKALEMVPHVTLSVKLDYLKKVGVLEESPTKLVVDGRLISGAKALSYQGRKIKVVSGYRGRSKWKINGQSYFHFESPHDLAIDSQTKTVLAYALS